MKEFVEFRKIARFSRISTVTEKIDGTNASIFIGDDGEFLVGSRTRWITPENDNAGFARWAYEHKEELLGLGAGHHFGEWWGSGIQRTYGLKGGEKRFSLFNVSKWGIGEGKTPPPACCGVVPVLWEGLFDNVPVEHIMSDLKENGSVAMPGFMDPEGIVIYHVAAGVYFKKTLKNDETPKSLQK